MESLAGLRERRAFECRLTQDRALGSLDEAEGFLGSAACSPGRRTARCPASTRRATRRRTSRAAGASPPGPDQVALVRRAHRARLSLRRRPPGQEPAGQRRDSGAARPDLPRGDRPDACRGAAWRRLLDHLAGVGPSLADDLRVELGLKRQELKALRSPLERCGVLVARSVTLPAGAHGATDARRPQPLTQRARPLGSGLPGRPGPAAARPSRPSGALGDLIVAAVRAAVVAPESEVRRWFSWQWYWTATLVDDLVRAARLRRVEDCLTAR